MCSMQSHAQLGIHLLVHLVLACGKVQKKIKPGICVVSKAARGDLQMALLF